MKYGLFLQLYEEATQYNDVENYIAERGWQEWMDDYGTPEDVSTIIGMLERIYQLAHMGIKEMRQMVSPSRAAFSRLYGIPDRTLQEWEYGNNHMPEYTKKLIAHTLLEERRHE